MFSQNFDIKKKTHLVQYIKPLPLRGTGKKSCHCTKKKLGGGSVWEAVEKMYRV